MQLPLHSYQNSGRAASGGALAPEPPRATRFQPRFIFLCPGVWTAPRGFPCLQELMTLWHDLFYSSIFKTLKIWWYQFNACLIPGPLYQILRPLKIRISLCVTVVGCTRHLPSHDATSFGKASVSAEHDPRSNCTRTQV